MKSLISNYLNSRRSIKLDDPSQAKESDENKQNEIEQTDNDKSIQSSLEDSILNLNLKFIDENDSDSVSNSDLTNFTKDTNNPSQIDSHFKNKTSQYC